MSHRITIDEDEMDQIESDISDAKVRVARAQSALAEVTADRDRLRAALEAVVSAFAAPAAAPDSVARATNALSVARAALGRADP